jgi:aspartate aminotransferase
MTVGAASGLNVAIKALVDPGEEILAFAPYFVEYGNYAKNHGAQLRAVPADTNTFQPNLDVMEQMITEKTRAVIINSPNNPTGVVYSEEVIRKVAEVLEAKQKELGTSIYLIADEPYRELVYDGVTVPYLTKYYRNTIVGYSYSKSLSLPGERIGYLVMPDEIDDADEIIPGAAVANRVLGFVNAPSLIQRAIKRVLDSKVDVEIYNRNRELLLSKLTEYGYTCVKPQGAFYLFVKAPGGDDKAFVQAAKKYHLLLVAGSGFGGPGYLRIAYCVDYDMIVRSLPAFKSLAEDYGL